jgi:hypothetical protein
MSHMLIRQGNPYSRAMMAPWINIPPRRSTIPAARGTTKVMLGSTVSQTRISPF